MLFISVVCELSLPSVLRHVAPLEEEGGRRYIWSYGRSRTTRFLRTGYIFFSTLVVVRYCGEMIRGGRYLALISRQRLGMQTGGSVSRRPALHSWTTVKNFSSSSDPKVAKEDESQSADEEAKEVEIYHKPQGFTIRVMFGISTVNLMVISFIEICDSNHSKALFTNFDCSTGLVFY